MEFLLKIKLFINLISKSKITLRKLNNFIKNNAAYYLKRTTASISPSMLIVEPTNSCNLSCTSCRDGHGIYDLVWESAPKKIPLGNIDINNYKKAIDELKDDILCCILYLQGEPLLSTNLIEMLGYAKKSRVATMIATNGMLLTSEISRQLIESDLDFIKIVISGFSQEVYGKYHKKGDVEIVKNNIRNLVKIRKERNSHLFIMLDYILFEYNTHELSLVRDFCKEIGIESITRIGFKPFKTQEGFLELERVAPSAKLCDWLWNIMILNWDKTLMPCCAFATSSSSFRLGSFDETADSLKAIWNSASYKAFRKRHIEKGRGGFLVCDRCNYGKIGLQTDTKNSSTAWSINKDF